ncbi:MAG: 2-oxo acid dehydrogenase subunit E2, partial [Blastococcus sp.]|nr:2-oxo acid dehydrogenase subunit E2 [Blastococcus sp.]
GRGRQFVSPLVRRLARERGLDLSAVTGSGPGGRIVRRDIEGLAATAAPATAPAAVAPAVSAASAPSSTTEIPHTGMRRAIARRLTESKSTVPHFYLVADCRVDRLISLRAEINEASSVKISVNDLVLKAAAAAFLDVPEANATWGETAVTRYSTVDMSVAVSIEGGLVTPVLRSVERMTLTEIATTVADLAERARSGRLKQHELEGGSFAVSNLGMYGITEFSAIINPPQSAILAVGRATAQAIVVDGALAVGTVMTVTLSADHRVLDGALAAQWLAAFQKRVENPVGMLV